MELFLAQARYGIYPITYPISQATLALCATMGDAEHDSRALVEFFTEMNLLGGWEGQLVTKFKIRIEQGDTLG